uniref:Methyltransf_25 domain-containing protein n=1 Tax=Hydatigena taeniaeformis TaxID=6205 RepID=A0A158RD88_HYDTA
LALTRARRRLEGGMLLDVGCGTGILSMFGAKAGAAHVYALDGVANLCSLARQIIAENHLSSAITVINSKVEDAQLGVDRVDAIVSEWMGHALLYENMLSSVLCARDRYLHPPHTTVDLTSWRRERLFPCRASISLAAFSTAPVNGYGEEEEGGKANCAEYPQQWEELSKLYGALQCECHLSWQTSVWFRTLTSRVHLQEGIGNGSDRSAWWCWNERLKQVLTVVKLSKVNLTGAFARAVQEDLERRVHVDMVDPQCVVSSTSVVATLDLAVLSVEALCTQGIKGTFEVKSMGTVLAKGLVIWFSVEFPDGDVLSTSPYKASTHWQQSLLYLSRPLPLHQDDVLSGEVHFTHPQDSPRAKSYLYVDLWCLEGSEHFDRSLGEPLRRDTSRGQLSPIKLTFTLSCVYIAS